MNQPREAIVSLGHSVTPEGLPDDTGIKRADTAIAAWRNDEAPYLVFTGGRSFLRHAPQAVSNAAAGKGYAVAQGVPEASVLTDEEGLETIGEALFTKINLAIPRSWEHLKVATSRSHLPRALGVFRHVYGDEFDIEGIGAPGRVAVRDRIYEPLGGAMLNAVLRGTRAGDHETIRGRLFELVPGYSEGVTIQNLAVQSLAGLFRPGKVI